LVYEPQAIDTSNVQLDEEILELIERLAENVHNNWTRERIGKGWRYGLHRDNNSKENPFLVPYQDLPESEKELNRRVIMETLKAMLALGYHIEKVP
jgi:hypothetical protein